MTLPDVKDLKDRTYTIAGGCYMTKRMMDSFGCKNVDNLDDAEIVIFTGGADVSPSLYGQKRIQGTYCDPRRDEVEIKIFGRAGLRLKAGICRGGQFLNVMSGGTMWQDVDNHAIGGSHPLHYYHPSGAEQIINVTSTHHQMMRRSIPRSCLWGGAGLTTFKKDEGSRVGMPSKHLMDEEIIYYPETRSLCFQPHPEYNNATPECTELFAKCLARALAYNPPKEL